jgi:hypothetical protein
MAQTLKQKTSNSKQRGEDTWSALKNAWRSYKMARLHGDKIKTKECARLIRDLQKDLGAQISEFPELNLTH